MNPIFSDMQTWVADTRRVTFDDLMDEVEHYMSVHLQQREAKRVLQVISQKHGENTIIAFRDGNRSGN
jgi:hypothetical protein